MLHKWKTTIRYPVDTIHNSCTTHTQIQIQIQTRTPTMHTTHYRMVITSRNSVTIYLRKVCYCKPFHNRSTTVNIKRLIKLKKHKAECKHLGVGDTKSQPIGYLQAKNNATLSQFTSSTSECCNRDAHAHTHTGRECAFFSNRLHFLFSTSVSAENILNHC